MLLVGCTYEHYTDCKFTHKFLMTLFIVKVWCCLPSRVSIPSSHCTLIVGEPVTFYTHIMEWINGFADRFFNLGQWIPKQESFSKSDICSSVDSSVYQCSNVLADLKASMVNNLSNAKHIQRSSHACIVRPQIMKQCDK